MRHCYWLSLLLGIAAIAAASVNATVTYYKDVLPILQTHCQSCHRPNQLAPISFLTYRETRPWAEEIQLAVTSRKMPPPWTEESVLVPRTNHGGLTVQEVHTIIAWVEQGAVEGDPHDAPPPLYFYQARQTGQPLDFQPKRSPAPSDRRPL